MSNSSFQVWYDFEAVRWLNIDVFFWDSLIFEYLWFHIFFYFLWWCLCVLGPFLNFWRNDYLDFDHIRLEIVFSVPFKVKMSFPRPFYFDFSIFGLSLRFFQYLVAFLATNSSDLPVLSIFEKIWGHNIKKGLVKSFPYRRSRIVLNCWQKYPVI